MLFCVFFGVIFWLLERGHNKDIQHHYWPGIMDGLWHAFKKPWSVEGHVSRALVWPLWVITLLFSSIITAQVIERYDLQKENALFKSNTDYSEVRIGMISESSADQRLTPRADEFKQLFAADNIEELYEALHERKIDAIVGEQPLLLDIKTRAKDDGVTVAIRPERLSEELYGIAISYGVDWRVIRDIDKNIMELRDNGFIKSLEKKWLSEESASKPTKVKLGSK
jgi:ABC-type amino acid transport substrate-binding protein